MVVFLKLSLILDQTGTYYGLLGIGIENNISSFSPVPAYPYAPSSKRTSPMSDLKLSLVP